MENRMYNAPLFHHTPERNDFFCVLTKGKLNEKKIVIRKLEGLYTVG